MINIHEHIGKHMMGKLEQRIFSSHIFKFNHIIFVHHLHTKPTETLFSSHFNVNVMYSMPH
jgi:hypothetical protein